ncbi:hypothetical protein [Natrialba asiatica]|uniref:Uncharacterized protein n=1 Tax=Natrialba asiatica (strain ATCC 700177 / DSM 12278 / JCM 9576 / FERM P-10747 / NBRC 102637 / 172P1) TaxID=29540 RepID=M0AKI9_NATA1|nr:hypothetical protein [Natrialba asiatica]ELY97903.1 hypothetical protein C481_18245 [Natrialba asiatica DSM 12278]
MRSQSNSDDITTDTINDLVVLGRAGPELISDGRHTVCLGGWSDKKGFVRIYPTHRYTSHAKRWNVIEVPVEQDPSHDWRDESWKIQGSKRDWDDLYKKVEQVGRLDRDDRIELTKQIPKTCANRLNDEKKSMGLVEPAEIHDAYLEPIDDPEPIATDLTGEELRSKNSYPHKLRIEYTCEDCEAKGNHDQHTIEWGIYRFWDKEPDNPEQVINNLRLLDDDYKKYFFIGNLKNQPRAFVIISIIRWKKEDVEQRSLDQFI